MDKQIKIYGAAAIAVAAVVLLAVFLKRGPEPVPQPEGEGAATVKRGRGGTQTSALQGVGASPQEAASEVRTPTGKTSPTRTRGPKKAGILTAAEKTTQTLDSLLDDNNTEAVLAEAKKLIKNPDAEVRSRVAFALSWTGVRGLADLTAMLGDPDPEVVQEVRDYWMSGVSNLSNSEDKAAMLDGAYQVTGDYTDNDFLETILGEFNFVEEVDALPRLDAMLGQTSNPQHEELIREAIDFQAQPEEPSETKQQARKAIRDALAKLSAEEEIDL